MNKMLTWAPRILGILFTLFISLFAFDVFEGPSSVWEKILAFLIHLTPVYFLAAGVWLGWKRPLIGGIIFLGFGLWFFGMALFMSRVQNPASINLIGVLPCILGILFLADWWQKRTHKRLPAA